MKTRKKIFSHTLWSMVKLYLLSISFFALFRLILFFKELGRLHEDTSVGDIFNAFFLGLRFDLAVSGYVYLLVGLILFVQDIFKVKNKLVDIVIFTITTVFFSVFFLICAADIPYFANFFSRFNIGALSWMDSPSFVFGMIVQDWNLYIYFVLFLIALLGFYKISKPIFFRRTTLKISWLKKVPLYIVLLGLIFLGVRGRLAHKSPLVIGVAYFCNDTFLNELGLNPVFTFFRSYLDAKNAKHESLEAVPRMMSSNMAEAKVKSLLNVPDFQYNSPVARWVQYNDIYDKKYNIVLILMESMSAYFMKRNGYTKPITPFLDSLSQKAIYFDNYYTSGIHTNHGLYSSVFSFPVVYNYSPMKNRIFRQNNLAHELKKYNYRTLYFTTHDGQFDNIGGFFKNNGFEDIISQKDYPYKEVKTVMGVPDDYMFRFALPILSDKKHKEKPFLAVMLTGSNHSPYHFPSYFSSKQKGATSETAVEYSDWSLKRFIHLAKEETWYKDTVFIFSADHGKPIENHYEVPLSYVHSPLIIHLPEGLRKKQKIDKIASQVDLFPTIMGILKLSYLNNGFGIDLFKEDRSYTIFNFDSKVGVIGKQFLLIIKLGNPSKLYKYRTQNRKDLASQYPDKVKEMEDYANANMQVSIDMLKNKQVFVE